MDAAEILLAATAIACSAAALYLFASGGYVPIWRWVSSGAEKDSARYQAWVDELFLDWTPAQTHRAAIAARISIVAVALAILIVLRSAVFAAAAAYAAFSIPVMLFRQARERRLKRLEEQLPEAISVMVSSVRAGSALSQAVEEVSHKIAGPCGQEFGVIAREQRLGGLTIEDALARAKTRLPVESFTMIASALMINSSQGGDLLHILERIGDAIRELSRLQKKIETETSEVRAQEKVILFMTPLFLILVCFLDPAIPDILFHSITGNILLVLVAGMQVLAFFWIRSIVKTTI